MRPRPGIGVQHAAQEVLQPGRELAARDLRRHVRPEIGRPARNTALYACLPRDALLRERTDEPLPRHDPQPVHVGAVRLEHVHPAVREQEREPLGREVRQRTGTLPEEQAPHILVALAGIRTDAPQQVADERAHLEPRETQAQLPGLPAFLDYVDRARPEVPVH